MLSSGERMTETFYHGLHNLLQSGTPDTFGTLHAKERKQYVNQSQKEEFNDSLNRKLHLIHILMSCGLTDIITEKRKNKR